MHWQEVLPGLFRFEDSCNVYAICSETGALIVNAGTGRWLAHLDELPKPARAVALTHFFRDHTAGAVEAARQGLPIWVPEGSRAMFEEPHRHFQRRETYIIYDNLWDLYAPIEPIPVTDVLRDHARIELANITFDVLPLPGATVMQTGLACEHRGQRIAFTGEVIHSPGKVPRIAPYQYNYNDMPGAVNNYYSCRILREGNYDAMLPSLGQPILSDCDGALAAVQRNLRQLTHDRNLYDWQMDQIDAYDALVKVTDHLYVSPHGIAQTWFVISDSGKALSIDFGYAAQITGWPNYPHPENRRAILHGLAGLKKELGIERIDTVLVSHFHDDHVAGIPLLQRLFDTQCWAGESFADLLTHPEGHCFPCNWPHPCRVDRRIGPDEEVDWEEYTFHFGPMSGHTRFSHLIGFEVDGLKVAHTGDQYFFSKGYENFDDNLNMPNWVYRNGALLDGYRQSDAWMQDFRPDMILSGHAPAYRTDDAFFKRIAEHAEHYEQSHRAIMPLDDDQPHLNLDSWGGWIWPYRTHLDQPMATTVRVTVRNPLHTQATLELSLVGPAGWQGSTATVQAQPRAEVSVEMTITPGGPCMRQPFAVEVVADGKPLGQVAEALMSVGGETF